MAGIPPTVVHDTIRVVVHDTTLVRDTVAAHDTILVHVTKSVALSKSGWDIFLEILTLVGVLLVAPIVAMKAAKRGATEGGKAATESALTVMREEARARRVTLALRLAFFLEKAGKQIDPLVDFLEKEGHAVPAAPGYSRAEYPLMHVETFEGMRASLLDLGDAEFASKLESWHQVTTHDLKQIIDYRTLIAGDYLKKYAPADPSPKLLLIFESIRASLKGDADTAGELAKRVKKIADEKG